MDSFRIHQHLQTQTVYFYYNTGWKLFRSVEVFYMFCSWRNSVLQCEKKGDTTEFSVKRIPCSELSRSWEKEVLSKTRGRGLIPTTPHFQPHWRHRFWQKQNLIHRRQLILSPIIQLSLSSKIKGLKIPTRYSWWAERWLVNLTNCDIMTPFFNNRLFAYSKSWQHFKEIICNH